MAQAKALIRENKFPVLATFAKDGRSYYWT
jgi:hypothetical protein